MRSKNTMDEMYASASDAAMDLVRSMSDFWIQRTSPFTSDFAATESFAVTCDKVSGMFPDADLAVVRSAVRSGFCSALEVEKARRHRDGKWDPYGPSAND